MKARIIVTRKCTRDCALCCNKFESIRRRIVPLDMYQVVQCSEISLSGGEPGLEVGKTISLIEKIRKASIAPIWVYASISTNLEKMLPWVDGIQYTIHSGANVDDIADFKIVQGMLLGSKLHNRLKVDCSAPPVSPIIVQHNIWSEIKLNKFYTNEELIALAPNGGIPNGEILFEVDK